jgi:pimeloyl-ACP methyl ester carboxylesterase/DNA-binding CsgD family transcriptional regulator
MRPWVEDLSRRYRLLRFDQRGTGLSDREGPEISFEAHVRDLERVIDAAGFERFALLGLSQGAASAVRYAARHAGRVSHLAIYGGFARGWLRRDYARDAIEKRETQLKLIELGWGGEDSSFRQVFSNQFMPDAPVEAIRAFNDFMPLTASARTAATIFAANNLIDVQDDARRVGCPALVVHGRGDLRVPFEEGRLLAGLIPGARFVGLQTRNHLMMQDEPAWAEFLATLAEFYPSRPGSSTSAFPSLTAREREILDLVAEGRDNAQIAACLALSEKTVRNNITHIFDKIQVENRSQAIVLAREAGLGSSRRER